MSKINLAILFVFSVLLVVYFFSTYNISSRSSYSIGNGVYKSRSSENPRPSRVFCMIKSYVKSYRKLKPQVVYKVWGHKCDDYRILMVLPDELRPADWKLGEEVEIDKPLKILQPKTASVEVHSGITLRIYHAMLSIYKRFPDFDWYYLVDDDAYVNVNNLRAFLDTKDPEDLVTYGYDFSVAFYLIKLLIIF